MLKLISFKSGEDGEIATYELSHLTGGRHGTNLTSEIVVSKKAHLEQVEVAFKIDPVILQGSDIEAALNQMADWLIRSGDALKTRGTPIGSFAINYERDE